MNNPIMNAALRVVNFFMLCFLWLVFALVCGDYVHAQQPQVAEPNPQTLQGYNSKWANGVAPGYYPTCNPATCTSTLVLNVGPGTCFDSAGARHAYAGGTLTMTGSATNYVYLAASNCALTQNTSGYPTSAAMPIATVTATTTITAIVDDRTWFSGVASGSSGCPLSNGVNTQTVSYTLLSGDSGKLVVMNGSSLTATLANPPPTSTWCATIQNFNATALTISRNTLTINGGTSNVTLQQYQMITLWTDGSNYYATRPLVAGSNITLTQNPNSESVAAASAGSLGGVSVKTANYTLTAVDSGKLIVMNCSSACTATLYATPSSTYFAEIISIGSIQAAISLNSLTYNGASTVPTLNNQIPLLFWSDGTNYYGNPIPLVTDLDARKNSHGTFVTCAHTNNVTSGTEKISCLTSYDGLTWTQFGSSPISATAERDPALMHYDGKWWIAATSGASNSWDLFTSTDLITWTGPTAVSVSGVAGVTNVWAPNWFVDNDGTVHVYVALSTDSLSTQNIYEMHPTARDMSTWSTPTNLTASGFFTRNIDPDVVRVGNTYYMFFKDDTSGFGHTGPIDLATSLSPTSGWTVTQSGNWAGWQTGLSTTTIEGPQVVQLDDGRWRIYFTNNNALSALNVYYSETTDPTFATGWSSATVISSLSAYNHPVPNRYPGAEDLLDSSGMVQGFREPGCSIRGVSALTTGYTFTAADSGTLFTFSGSSLTATLPSTPPNARWCITIQNQNASNLTVSRNSLHINGGTTDITLAQYQRTSCSTDGGNYFCSRPLVAGSNVTISQSPEKEVIAATASATMAKLCTGTATSQATLLFDSSNNCSGAHPFTSTYNYYTIRCDNVKPASGSNTQFNFRVGLNGTYDTGSQYRWSWIVATNNFSAATSSGSSTLIQMGTNVTSTHGEEMFDIAINNPLTTSYNRSFSWTGSILAADANPYTVNGAGQYLNSSNTFNDIEFLMTSGNITSATCTIWGLP